MQSDHAPLPEGSALGQWGKFFVEGGKKIGRTFTVLEDGVQRRAMEAAGFVDIQEYDFKVRPSFSPPFLFSLFCFSFFFLFYFPSSCGLGYGVQIQGECADGVPLRSP